MYTNRLVAQLGHHVGAGPAYLALADGIRRLALDGRLPVGARVPSERDLAAALRVSRNTITAAYDVLRAEGYLTSARGGGSRIGLPAGAPIRPDLPADARPGVLDLTVAALPAPPQLLDAVDAAARSLRPLLSGHGLHPFGLPQLREQIAAHLSDRGLPTRPTQVLVTNGALHAWDLLLRVLTKPGDRVLVEQPTYPAVLDAVEGHALRAVPLAVSADGWELPAPTARLAHVTPDAQNPTGLVATPRQRDHLLAGLAGQHVVADETFADLVLDGPVPGPMATRSRDVITVGSMSKAFWAGLRVGWVRGEPELLARLARARGASDLAGPVLDQLVAAHLLAAAEQVLPLRREQLRRRRDALCAALGAALPGWRFVRPAGGMVLWVELPEPGATRLAAHALDLGLRVTPGPRFAVDGLGDRFLRLPYTSAVESMPAIVQLLGQAAERTAAGAVTASRVARWTA